MADSVRFPPSIGGSGRTYTNDSNPDTGLFNGGHRTNLFPMLGDTVQAAGYVSRFAQAIDGAKENADKAENAQGYVEAVAAAVRMSILDPYRARATLGLDFVKGRYFVDDGTRIESNNVVDVMHFERASPKWARSPNAKRQMFTSDKMAREWLNGRSEGASLEDASTNLVIFSNDLTANGWAALEGVTRLEKVDGLTTISGDGRVGSVAVRHSSANPIRVENGQYYTVSGVFKPLNAKSLLVYLGGAFTEQGGSSSVRIRFDTAPLSAQVVFNASGSNISNIVFRPLGDGRYFFSLTAQSYSVSDERPIYYASDINLIGSTSMVGEGISLGELQVEVGRSFSSYVPTTDSPVTRDKDLLYRNLGEELNRSGSTLYMEFNPRQLGYRRGLLTLARTPEESNNTFGVFTSTGTGGIEIASFTFNSGGDSAVLLTQVTPNVWYRVAFTFNSQGRLRASWNGRPAGEVTGNALWDLLKNNLSLCIGTSSGRVLGANNGYEQMNVREILLLPFETTNSELEEMTR